MDRILSATSAFVLLLIGSAGASGCAHRRGPAPSLVPGDSRLGLALFEQRGCATCHRLPGDRDSERSPLRASGQAPTSEAAILAALWNHAPRMWARMDELGIVQPRLDPREMADLFAFLYYLTVLDPPGDPELGHWAFMARGCDACHAVSLEEPERIGPSLPYWSSHTTPIRLARAMWRHATQMQDQLNRMGRPWIELQGTDLADIVAYVREVNEIATTKQLILGDQVRGRNLFSARRCARCHSTRPDGSGIGPSIQEMNGSARSLGELGARMWNHFPRMRKLIGDEGVARLRFSTAEMADLFAFLFSLGYFDVEGDPVAGRAVYSDKACEDCHDRPGSPGGRLRLEPAEASPVAVASALWNHGPGMLDSLRGAGRDWPELSAREAADLLAFLRLRSRRDP